MENIFHNLLKLYSTHNSGSRTPLEDFTTEILAPILSKDRLILDCFMNEVLLVPGEQFEIHTQQQYLLEHEKYCIIDIVISNKDTICFLENKVNSKEGYRQLEKYKTVLKSLEGNKNTYLRYCTKHYDFKEIADIDFHQIRWRDIYLFLINYEEDSIIREFLHYLRRIGMAGADDFNINDMMVMNSFYETMTKMNECLDAVIPEFTAAFGEPNNSKKAWLRQIPEFNRYTLWKEDIFIGGHSNQSKIVLGFDFEALDAYSYPIIFLGLVCNNKHNNYSDIKNAIELDKDFDEISTEDSVWGWYEKSLSDFLSTENQLLEIKRWFVESISKLVAFKERNSEMNWNSGK